MLNPRTTFYAFLTFLFCASLAAQQPAQLPLAKPPAPTRDPQALVTIQNAVLAMGGSQIIGAIRNITVRGTAQTVPASPGDPTTFVWVVSGADYRYENDGAQGSHTLISNGGNPVDVRDGKAVPIAYHVSRATLPFHLPAVLLYSELSNANYSFHFVGQTTVGGRPAIQVHAEDDSDSIGPIVTPQEWYFDVASNIPLRVEYRLPDAARGTKWTEGSMDFSSFQLVKGMLIPFGLAVTDGPISLQITAVSATVNENLPANTFTPSVGASQ